MSNLHASWVSNFPGGERSLYGSPLIKWPLKFDYEHFTIHMRATPYTSALLINKNQYSGHRKLLRELSKLS